MVQFHARCAIHEVMHDRLRDPKYRPGPLLRKYVAAGWYGRTSGRGFYSYAT
jgi:3-hydroxybutyryl-CoA dehydrogenase